ncbi:MAG: prolipoprotein diacylglyceryl transferase [Tepidisphaera sp.]|nr:prolipoprotein diacylglyceryl transferase [Tepidisphaera sp.]
MFTLAAWLHDLSPFLVRFTDDFGLRWYGLSYAAGFVVAYVMLQKFSKMGLTPLSRERLGDAMMTLVLGVVVGGRLGYALFYEPAMLWTFGGGFPWWGLLRLNQGGMASHGGMLGVLTATWFITRRAKRDGTPVPWLHVCDLTAIACTPGLFFGRMANFVNAELLGKIVAMPGQPAPWWAVKYPTEAFTTQAPPGQAEALKPLIEPFRLKGETYEEGYRHLLEVLRSGTPEAHRLAEKLSPLISARHPSQLYQGLTEGLLVGLVLWFIWRKPRHAGALTSAFLVCYGIVRILTEFIRLPDAQLAVQRIMGLSRGQWLSVAMIVAGLLVQVLVPPSKELFGGWGKKREVTK